jgi:hypothetical protein
VSLSRALGAGAALAGLGLALACASALRTEQHPALREQPLALERIAVAPFRAAPTLAADAERRRELALRVARDVAEALDARGLRVIPASELAAALGLETAFTTPLDARAVASRAGEQFGVQAVLLGAVLRFRERSGEPMGSSTPASVSFEVTLHAAPGGERLWTALFDETQQALFSNLLNLGRYPGAGTRWLSAEELTRWGAREVAAALPTGSPEPGP